MRVVFMGTPEFAVPSLRKLAEAAEVTLVVTRPDAVRSRGKKLEPSPVKVTALELGIPVLEASRIREEQLAAVRAAEPDLIAVAAYGCILPDALLEIAPKGCVNVHASLLPRWRGAAPVQRAVLAGDERVGVSRSSMSSTRAPTARRPPARWASAGLPSSCSSLPSWVRMSWLMPCQALRTARPSGSSRTRAWSPMPTRSTRARCASPLQTARLQTCGACEPRAMRLPRVFRWMARALAC